MVVELGVDVSLSNISGSTPLRTAANSGAAKCVKYLLTLANSNPGDVPPEYSGTAAETAETHGFPEVAKMIQNEVRCTFTLRLFCARAI
jgi:ankyrin repeat protein